MGLDFHPLASLFPMIEGEEFAELVADVRKHGVREPIVIYQNKILDGRNRYRAAIAAGVEARLIEYDGDDPLAYVISLNLKRRHLDELQRAMVAARIATLRRGANQHSPIGETSQADAAAMLNVGKRTVERAREVIDEGVPELAAAVDTGAVSVSAAADVATLPKPEQQEIVARGEREILEAARRIRAEKGEVRRKARVQRMIEASAGNTALPQDRTYPIILADPPWPYEHNAFGCWTLDVEEHYPTMELEDICAMPVIELAAPNALLFLWSPTPKLEEAMAVIRAWGFNYRTGLVWIKQRTGTGQYLRQRHEHLLIARRGEFPTPEPANRPDSVIEAPRREHSRKPDEAYELIERMYPDLPKIELFARTARAGWTAWGNEAPIGGEQDEDEEPAFLARSVAP